MTDAELTCLAVAQVLLRFDDERHWLRAAPRLVGHLFPRLLRQSEYNDRVQRPPQDRGAADGGRAAVAGRSTINGRSGVLEGAVTQRWSEGKLYTDPVPAEVAAAQPSAGTDS